EAVAVRPLRVLRVVPHVLVEEQVRDWRIAERRAGVTALGLLHCIDCQKTQCVDRCLLNVAHVLVCLSFAMGCAAGARRSDRVSATRIRSLFCQSRMSLQGPVATSARPFHSTSMS